MNIIQNLQDKVMDYLIYEENIFLNIAAHLLLVLFLIVSFPIWFPISILVLVVKSSVRIVKKLKNKQEQLWKQ